MNGDHQSLKEVLEERWDEIGNFSCRANYVPLGDYLTIFFSPSFAIAEQVDSMLTVYWCKRTGDLCGCKIKGVSILAQSRLGPAMSDDQIRDMLSAIIQEVDYDIWKELFLDDIGEIDRLVEIVREHCVRP